jgi:hypothetical protein
MALMAIRSNGMTMPGRIRAQEKTFSKVCIALASQKDIEQYEQTVAALRKARERELEYARISEIDKAFLANCKDAKKRGLTYVVVNSPQELGDTYDQVMRNLALLEKDCLYLRIIRKL